MKNYFYKLSDHAVSLADKNEFLMLNLSGEESDFIRLNHAAIRQNGNVKQYYLSITLIKNGRQASNFMTLTLDEHIDMPAVSSGLKKLRTVIEQLDEDPYILYSTEVKSTEVIEKNLLPDTFEAVSQIMETAKSLDLAGIFASGNVVAGFANSLGQRNWFEKPSFNFNWSVYHTTDKAVKAGYAGYVWNSTDFERKMKKVKSELEMMKRDAVTIKPGRYKVFIAPAALDDFMAMLGWGGFGLKSQRTKNSSLLKLIDGEIKLDSSVSITENSLEGSSPNFNSTGFIKQDKVELIKNGLHAGSLISPRSSKEFNVPTNGAGSYEEPVSLEMSAGKINFADVLKELGTGVYLNNVHYLNYSERISCRVTGMSRFAALWVENGEVVAPINVMRFDESIFRMLGSNFAGATVERERIMSTSTYDQRATDSTHLPGIFVNDFSFTL